ncbi:MAG: hypothetical protein Q4E33_01280 [Erysipelotrichaceae bacterium]|nr:hypothetical protein [Erysipelotrichaceae bacterium]
MSREIGSEFCSIPLQDEDNLVFSSDTKWFVSGRAALDYIIKDIKSKNNVKTVAIPSWCCESMIEPFIKNDIEVKFYSVTYDNELVINNNIEADILFRIDYFGYKQDTIDFKGIVVDDITHSIFSNINRNGDYVFGSLRKWAGFKTGGFAYSNHFSINEELKECDDYIELRTKAMSDKQKYLDGQIKEKTYLDIYEEAEEMLDSLYGYKGFDEDIYNARHLDINFIKNKRRYNAKVLLETVKQCAMFKDVQDDDCPMFVPILVENRDELRKYLIDNDVYCPIHWPISNLHKLTVDEKYIYDHELSLVCDQRYGVDDMKRISDLLRRYFDGE